MGLFNKRKNKADKAAAAAAEAAAAEAARVEAEQQRLAAEAAKKDAERRAAAAAKAAEREKGEEVVAKIGAKQKQIDQMEKALQRFEEEHRKAAQAAIKAKHDNRMVEAKSHMRTVTRLKKRIEQHQTLVVNAQTQLDALQDMAIQREAQSTNQEFVNDMKGMKLDADAVDETLQDMRDALEQVNEVNNAVKADAEMNQGLYNEAEALDELEALEKQFAEEAAQDIPSVPGEVPAMPAAASAKAPPSAVTLNEKEEEEMRRLEADIAM